MTRLFVYGTLKRGRSNHHFLIGQQFAGAARTLPLYRMFDLGGYPGLVLAVDNGLAIEGELWDVDEACLGHMDRLEGVDQAEYRRQVIEMAPPFRQGPVEGYVYLRSVRGLREIGAVW